MKESGVKVLVHNKKASFNYFLSDFLEAGIELKGTEVKSVRNHGTTLNDAYVIIRNREAYLINMNIAPYKEGNIFNHEPLRNRRLLLHRREIDKLQGKVQEKDFTLVPTRIYLRDGLVKVEIALGKGKKNYDKREAEKEKDDKRYIEKVMKSKNY